MAVNPVSPVEAGRAPINPKVKAGGAGTGIAGALTILLVYIGEMAGLDIPPEVASAFTTVIALVAGVAAGYLKTA